MSDGADDGLFPSTVGEQLAAERTRQKLELVDIAARTRIPMRHLQAIETGHHDGLPALPYSAGFVKTYANMLGLDGNALSRAFRVQMGDAQRAHFEPEAYEPVDPTRVPTRLLSMIALGVALLLGVMYLLLRFESDSSDLAKLAADTVEDVRPAPPRSVAPPPAVVIPVQPAVPAGPISIAAASDVWIKVSERDGSKTYFINVLPGGQSFAVPDDAIDPILRTGLPQAVKVLIGETELPPIGEPDRLVRAYSLKRDALVAIATARPGDQGAIVDGTAPVATASATDEPASRPRRPRRLAPTQDPAGSRPDSTEAASESGQGL